MSNALLRLLALVLVLGWFSPVRADDPPGYAHAIEMGLAEFGNKNFEEARAHFLQAHTLAPNARTLRALGMVEFELKNYVDSVRFLEQALASSTKPLEAEKRSDAARLLETGNGYVARYRLRVAAETRVSLDGNPLDDLQMRELMLEIGKHQLEFHAPGRISQRRELKVKGGERETVSVTLAELEPAAAGSAGAAGSRADKPVYKNPWLWSAVGVLVAGAAAGALVAVYGRDSRTKMEPALKGYNGAEPISPPP